MRAGAQLKAMASSAVSTRRILQSRPSTSYPISYSMNSKIIVSALVILCVIVLIIIFLHVYAKRLRRRSSSMSRRLAALHQSLFSQDTAAHSGSGGLGREIVEVLPVFTYKPQLCLPKAATMAASGEGVECVVCLSDFQQDEACKLLPKCKHFFHIECIDVWFLSNTTCPVCRTAADPHSDGGKEAAHADVGCGSMSACCFTKQDGEEHYQRPVTPTSAGAAREDIAVSRGSFSLQSPATSRNYRRSKSEKFSKGTQQRTSLATNSFFEGGNHTNSTLRMNRTRWQTGGRSFSHTTLDISKPQEINLFEVSSGRAFPAGAPAVASCAASSSDELKTFY